MLPKFVICGIEHSGTTMLSDIFRQTPQMDSGFEVGVLLCDTPREFRQKEPFVSNMVSGWKLKETDLDHLCDTDSLAEFYARLKQTSNVVNPEKELFDKTPRYLLHLGECMARARVPFIATYKDPRSIVHSDFKRAKTDDFEAWYPRYQKAKKSYMRQLYANFMAYNGQQGGQDQVCFVPLEELCVNTAASLKRVFHHAGVEFSFQYILLKNLRYHHTVANFIDNRVPFQYLDDFSPETIARIETDFAEFEHWFYR